MDAGARPWSSSRSVPRPASPASRAQPAAAVWRPVAGTHLDMPEAFGSGSTVRLRPYEGIIAVAD